MLMIAKMQRQQDRAIEEREEVKSRGHCTFMVKIATSLPLASGFCFPLKFCPSWTCSMQLDQSLQLQRPACLEKTFESSPSSTSSTTSSGEAGIPRTREEYQALWPIACAEMAEKVEYL
jgi:hypothetical protein